MRLRTLAAVALATPLLLAGCGSEDEGTRAAASPSASTPAASASPSASPEPAGSGSPEAPAPTGDAPPEFCEAARAFSQDSELDALAPDAPPEQVEAALTTAVEQTQALVETAPEDVRPTFEKLAQSYVQLKELVAEAGYVRADVDQARLAEIEPDTTPEEEQAVDDLVGQCGLS